MSDHSPVPDNFDDKLPSQPAGISTINALRRWVKGQKTPLAAWVYRNGIALRHMSVPCIGFIHRPLYNLTLGLSALWSGLTRVVWYTPLFQSRLETPASRLYLFNGMPFVTGPVQIRLGDSCRVGGRTDIVSRHYGPVIPKLIVGNNVDIGWGASITVGKLIRIDDNVRLAPGCSLVGYPGHPYDPVARARGDHDNDDQVGDIILERDVWLGNGVRVLGGVTIGRGTIVGTGSIVTSSLPPNVLAAGVPAKVIRSLDEAKPK